MSAPACQRKGRVSLEEMVRPESHCVHWASGGTMDAVIHRFVQNANCCWCGWMFLVLPPLSSHTAGHGPCVATKIGEPIGAAKVVA